MTTALYGPGGFFVSGAGPAAHFRTSANASPVLGAALARLVRRLDARLDHPDPFDLVDIGAGGGELLTTLAGHLPDSLTRRLRLTAVELAPRPSGLPATIRWLRQPPERIRGLVLATEWLDNVPLDVAEPTAQGWRQILVDPGTGREHSGGPVDPADAEWLARWWPVTAEFGAAGRPAGMRVANAPTGASAADQLPGIRAEVGRSRDVAWATAVGAVVRGAALAIDYGHLRADRPWAGTLTGYRDGRQLPAVPDGSRDITAHVAIDSVAAAGAAVAGTPYTLLPQRQALRALGVAARRPPLALATTDPTGYVLALATATAEADLLDPDGLGGHWWLLQPVGVSSADLLG